MTLSQRLRRFALIMRRRTIGAGVDHEPVILWEGPKRAPARVQDRKRPRIVAHPAALSALILTLLLCAAGYLVLAANDARAPTRFEPRGSIGATPAALATALALLRHAAPEAVGAEPPLLLSDKLLRRDLVRQGAARAVGSFAQALSERGGASDAAGLAPATALTVTRSEGAALAAAARALERPRVAALYEVLRPTERLALAVNAALQAIREERAALDRLRTGRVLNGDMARAVTVTRGGAMAWRALVISAAADAGYGAATEEAAALAAADRALAAVAAFEPLFFIDPPVGAPIAFAHPDLFSARLAEAERALAGLAGGLEPTTRLRGRAP